MRTVIEAGSDMASLCLFDPAALPADFLERPSREQTKLVDTLVDSEAALRISTGGDGSFHIHVYVDEDPPDHPGELVHAKGLVSSSGRLCLTGEEEIRPDAAESSGQSALSLPPGKYSVKAWRIPEDERAEAELVKQRAIAEVDPEAWEKYARGSLFSVLFAIALILGGMFCAVVTLLRFMGRNHFSWQGLVGLWAGWLILIQVVPRLMTSTVNERIAQISLEAQKDFPAYIIHLARV